VSDLRIGFAGTPDFAARILQGLLDGGRPPLVVYTQPDRPVGRGRRLRPAAVKVLAEQHGIEVRQPDSLRGADATERLAQAQLDVLVVAAYGLLLPPAILQTPTLGCINVHASILPRWRGAAPVERAIMAGDARTGVSIMQMDRGLDTGPVFLIRDCAIGPHATGPGLEHDLAALGCEALLECLDRLPSIKPIPQPVEGVCYAKKLTPADAAIDWSRASVELDRQIRALCGRMPAASFAGSTRVQILDADPDPDHPPGGAGASPGTIIGISPKRGISVACGAGTLTIKRLQLNRGKGLPLTAAQALNGFPELLAEGRVFHAEPR
jgi:methionyl-tRNA formyltransferase